MNLKRIPYRPLTAVIACLLLASVSSAQNAPDASVPDSYKPLIQKILKPQSAEERAKLADEIKKIGEKDPPLTRAQFDELEKLIRKDATYPDAEKGATTTHKVPIKKTGKEFPIYVVTPKNYNPAKATPLLVVMHGGPLDAISMAHAHAKKMMSGWKSHVDQAGWLMVATVEGTATTGDMSYGEIIEIVDFVKERYNVDLESVYLTGHSRGGFFSWAFGLAEPGRYAGIAPDCGGQFYEDGLRNAALLAVFNMQGKNDDQGNRNHILPRMAKQNKDKLDELKKQNSGMFDHKYRESELAHVSNVGFYAEALQWLSRHHRNLYAPRILGHVKQLGPSNRLYWFQLLDGKEESIEAACDKKTNEVKVTCEGLKKYKIFVHDALLDLDKPVKVITNGTVSFEGPVKRSAAFALQHIAETNDTGRVYANVIEITVN